MESLIDEEIMDNHNKADAFISLFFLGLDAIAYIVSFTIFSCDFKSLDSPNQKIYLFILLDGLSRLICIFTDAYRKTFVQETTFTLISSMQFHLSISMLEQIFTDQRNDSYMANELQIRNKNLFSFLFFCLVFSFKGILPSHGLLSSIQFICIFISISIFYKYMNNKIELYLTNVQKNNSQFTGRNFINNLPFFIFIYLGINYILQLFQLMLDNKLYESYMTMIFIIFKEVGKYLVVLLMIMIFNTFNKYVKTNEHSYTSQPIKPEEKKKVVQVYKDEDESVQF
jgi:hypothetical protein